MCIRDRGYIVVFLCMACALTGCRTTEITKNTLEFYGANKESTGSSAQKSVVEVKREDVYKRQIIDIILIIKVIIMLNSI